MIKRYNIYIFLILILQSSLYSQAELGIRDSIRLNVLRVHGVMTLPFYTSLKIDHEEVIKLESGTYTSLRLEPKKYIVSISKKESYTIKGNSDEYFFMIVFRKRLFWRKQDLIQVTKKYFESIDLSDYRQIKKNQNIKKWY